MSVQVQFIYDTPHQEVASILSGLYHTCTSAFLIAGFMTVEGIESILQPISSEPSKLSTLVVGAGTWRAFDAFDRLLSLGVGPDRLQVHLGHTRLTTSEKAKYAFLRYHPMLHSKVYLFEMPEGKSTAFVGSHNITGFALGGLNGEAGVLLEGPASSKQFSDIRKHISAAIADSVQYDPSQREAFAWWASQFMEGFSAKFNDLPREGEAQRTIVIIAETSGVQLPSSDDVIYFELPMALKRITSTTTQVHLFLFDSLPSTPGQALVQLKKARTSYWGRIIGVEDDQGGKELEAVWKIEGVRPVLRPVQAPFRPKPAPGMQQVRIKVANRVFEHFDYLFGVEKPSYEPILNTNQSLSLPPEISRRVEALHLIPVEHQPWFRVTGLRRTEDDKGDAFKVALRQLSPEEGSFIMVSMRRRRRTE